MFSSYRGSNTGSGITFSSLSFMILNLLIKIVKSLGVKFEVKKAS